MADELTPGTASTSGGFAAQQRLLAALTGGARLLRHRGPLGEPLPYTFTLHHDTPQATDETGEPVDIAHVRPLSAGKLIRWGPWPSEDPVGARSMVITEAGRRAHGEFAHAQFDDAAIPLAADTLAVTDAMRAGARLTWDGKGTYTLADGTAVATLTGHVLVTLDYAIQASDDTDMWELSDAGRTWAENHPR